MSGEKLKAAFAAAPTLQSDIVENVKKGGVSSMMTAMENHPKTAAIIKASLLSSREFLLVPSCVQMTASVYNSQAQGTVVGAVISQETLAFYAENKTEIDQLVKNWRMGPGGR